MKRLAIVVGSLLLVLALGGFAYVFLTAEEPETATEPSNSDPFGGLVSDYPDGSRDPGDYLTFRLSNGSTVSVPDFTKQDQPEWAGENGYLVNGNPEGDYMTTYIPADGTGNPGSITVVLQAEPLGEKRLQAEEALQAQFRVTDEELCLMGVSVFSQPGLSDVYDRRNLGLSFCPGAVRLP
jgi:hypothetical protein